MPKSRVTAASVLALALAAATAGAAAEPGQACADRTHVIQKLAERFGETLRSVGLHDDDGVVEIYSSDQTGTWTILVTHPDGKSCLLAEGQLWEQVTDPRAPGSDA